MAKGNDTTIGRQSGRQKKTPKGTVKIESDKGWLRLRFTHAGKRRAFALGLPDTSINRQFAEQKANQISLDIISSNFDPACKSISLKESIQKALQHSSYPYQSCSQSGNESNRSSTINWTRCSNTL